MFSCVRVCSAVCFPSFADSPHRVISFSPSLLLSLRVWGKSRAWTTHEEGGGKAQRNGPVSLWPLPPERYISRSQGPSGSENNGRETGNTPCHLHFASLTLHELLYIGSCELANWDGGNFTGTIGFDLNKSLLPLVPRLLTKHPSLYMNTLKYGRKASHTHTFHCCSLHLNLLSCGFKYRLDTQDVTINFPRLFSFSHTHCVWSQDTSVKTNIIQLWILIKQRYSKLWCYTLNSHSM